MLSTHFVLNHWSDKKVDLWGLWGGGGARAPGGRGGGGGGGRGGGGGGGGGAPRERTLPTPLPTGLYSCPASENVMSFWIKFVMIH